MMASDGRITMLEEVRLGGERVMRPTFISGRPMPESCNPRRVLSALDKISAETGEVSERDAADPPAPERACPGTHCRGGMLADAAGREMVSCPVCDGVLTPETYRALVAAHGARVASSGPDLTSLGHLRIPRAAIEYDPILDLGDEGDAPKAE